MITNAQFSLHRFFPVSATHRMRGLHTVILFYRLINE